MRYSPESLEAFVQAAALGSFSAAARKLKRTQSTISTAIANLETDLGVVLFDRDGRYPKLTDAGRKVLGYVQDILAASERLDELSIRLADAIEPRLTIVLSDTYLFDPDDDLMRRFANLYPDIDLECLIAEGEDVVDLVQSGRAHLGMMAARAAYPPDIATARLPQQSMMGLYIAHGHPLADAANLTEAQLAGTRRLFLNTYLDKESRPAGQVWSAPTYLMLLELAEQGFGWAELPCDLVKQYGRGRLSGLKIRGWPRAISVDVVWSKRKPPGTAGLWLLDQLLGHAA